MNGSVQNNMGPVSGHVQGGEQFGGEKELQNTGPKPGGGELEGSKVEVTDGEVRQEMLDGGQKSSGYLATIWGWAASAVSVGADIFNAAQEFVEQSDPYLSENEDGHDTVTDEPEVGRSTVHEGEDPSIQVDDSVDDFVVLEPLPPPSRQETLDAHKASSLVREGLRLGPKDEPKVAEPESREIEQMSQGIMEKMLGKAYSFLGWLSGGSSSAESVAQDTRNLSEQNFDQIFKLQVDAAKCLQKLDEQVRIITNSEKSIAENDLTKINPDASSLGLRDHAWRWGETAKASFEQAVGTLGWFAAGAGVAYGGSTVSSLTGGGISGSLAPILGGAYLGLSALRDLPDNITDKTTINVIEKSLVEINSLLDKVKQLTIQEVQRHELSLKLGMVSQGRAEKIERLDLELNLVDSQIARRKDLDDPDAGIISAGPSFPVAVGDGVERTETLSGMARVKNAFSSFFAPVVDGLARAGRFLGDALGLTDMSVLKRMDRSEEQTYEKTFSTGLQSLRKSLDDSVVNRDLIVKSSQRILGLSRELPTDSREAHQRTVQLDRQAKSLEPMLRMGENIFHHLHEGSGGSFGTLVVSSGADSHFVNSGQPTTRAICHYLDVLARDVGGQNSLGVQVADTGELVLPDPDRRLYQFLIGAPQAMSPLFANQIGVTPGWFEATEHSGQMWINDPSGRLPGGANRVVFEIGVEDGKDTLKLRFEHLDRDELVSSVLDVPDHSMLVQLRRMNTAYIDAHQSDRQPVSQSDDEDLMQRYANSNKRLGIPGEDYSNWSLERLVERREALLKSFSQEQVLLQRDNDSYQLLQNDAQLRAVDKLA